MRGGGGDVGVVVSTDLSVKELHRQVSMGRVMTSGNLADVMVSTLSQNASDAVLIPTLGTIFPIFSPLQYSLS